MYEAPPIPRCFTLHMEEASINVVNGLLLHHVAETNGGFAGDYGGLAEQLREMFVDRTTRDGKSDLDPSRHLRGFSFFSL